MSKTPPSDDEPEKWGGSIMDLAGCMATGKPKPSDEEVRASIGEYVGSNFLLTDGRVDLDRFESDPAYRDRVEAWLKEPTKPVPQ